MAVLISIRQEWCSKIARGQKTIEIRKTKPKLEVPFKCYIYCTKSKKNGRVDELDKALGGGMVIGEFVCDHILGHCEMANADMAEAQSCVRREDIFKYSGGKEVFGWHISDLVIYDKPKELSDFKQCQKCPYGDFQNCKQHEFSCNGSFNLMRPPQSWCYVEEATFTEGSECDEFNRQIGSKPMTHGDQIRAMGDEELAKLIYGVDGLGWCKHLPECIKQIGLIPEEKCIGCALEWLKQPAEVTGDA